MTKKKRNGGDGKREPVPPRTLNEKQLREAAPLLMEALIAALPAVNELRAMRHGVSVEPIPRDDLELTAAKIIDAMTKAGVKP
jgi:hypothetical protein